MASTAVPFPATILRLRTALYPSSALLAAIQLDLFTQLRDRPQDVGQLSALLNVDPDKLGALLYSLVACDLLIVDDGVFSNTPEAALYLVRGGDRYLGGSFESFARDRWNAVWSTAESVRSGSAQAKVDWGQMSPDARDSFFQAQHPISVRSANDLLSSYDFTLHYHLLDVGGGTGGLAITMTRACPNLKATVVDLPTVTPVAERFVAEANAGDRVQVVAADVVQEPPPGKYDVATLSALLPVLSPEEARQALRNLYQAIEPGGKVYIYDSGTLDDSRLAPLDVVWMNLWFINVFDRGGARTEGERRRWLAEAGFEPGERKTYPDGRSIMSASKPV